MHFVYHTCCQIDIQLFLTMKSLLCVILLALLLLVISSVPSFFCVCSFLPWTLPLLGFMESTSRRAYFLPLALISALLEIIVTLANHNQHSKLVSFFFFLTFYFDLKIVRIIQRIPMYLSSTSPLMSPCHHVCLIALSLPVGVLRFPSSVSWADLLICVCFRVCLSIHPPPSMWKTPSSQQYIQFQSNATGLTNLALSKSDRGCHYRKYVTSCPFSSVRQRGEFVSVVP